MNLLVPGKLHAKNTVQFGAAVLEKKMFLSISLYITMQKFMALGLGHL